MKEPNDLTKDIQEIIKLSMCVRCKRVAEELRILACNLILINDILEEEDD